MHFYTKTADWRSPIPFWRVSIYISEAEIVLGVLYRKGVIPKKGGTLDFRDFCNSPSSRAIEKNATMRRGYPDPPFHAFFLKKRGLAAKSAVSLLFCPFLRLFGPKRLRSFPCFRIFYPCFFRQNCAFLVPQMPFALRKKRG